MTRVLVLGGAGMLGHKAFQTLSERFETWVTFRRFDERLRASGLFPESRVIAGVDASALETVRDAVDRARPDVILNCVGVIKQLDAAKDARTSIYTNALFPHLLAAEASERGARVIHVSTDCVFSGDRGQYGEEDFADARDLYGRTKFLGELPAPHLTMRTSIVGRELFTTLSLLDWFLSQRGGTVRGFRRAIYTGFSTIALSREIARVIGERPGLTGLYHVSSEPITKYDLLHLWREAYGVEVGIEPDDAFFCDRSLRSERYRADAGFTPPSWPDMVREMARDATPYERIRGLA